MTPRAASAKVAAMTRDAPQASLAPDWDMTPYFSAPDGPDYRTFVDDLRTDIAALAADVEGLGALDAKTEARWVDALVALENASARMRHLGSYLGCLGSADTRDAWIQRETAALASLRAELESALVAARKELGEADDGAFESLCAHPALAPIRYALSRHRARASRMMAGDLERLAAELGVDGISAFGRLYGRVSGNLSFELALPDGTIERKPVAATRSQLEHPDPAVRKAALRGSNTAWESVADTVAACLNAISGTRLSLYARRGIGDFLEPALFDAGIERGTLDALFEAVRARQDLPRRYLRRKAALLGRERLGFQDLTAPLPQAKTEPIPWEAARERVVSAFSRAYPALADFARRAFDARWIDHTPRSGKRPGAFCSTSPVIGESRVFMNYGGALGDVQTLAHELGHAFHNKLMRDMRPWARQYPMTLAETASTFAEALVTDAILSDPDAEPAERLVILERRMQEGSSFLLNIPMRFAFERAVYERRATGELSVAELCELMASTQRDVYGDALAEDELDPWFWASKLHFYLVDISFYNFPYTFGYLFSRAITARASAEGPAFLPTYERLLRATGGDTAERVARDILGVDLGTPAFWSEAIDLIEADFARFESALSSS